jgi:hypothetical protein
MLNRQSGIPGLWRYCDVGSMDRAKMNSGHKTLERWKKYSGAAKVREKIS